MQKVAFAVILQVSVMPQFDLHFRLGIMKLLRVANRATFILLRICPTVHRGEQTSLPSTGEGGEPADKQNRM